MKKLKLRKVKKFIQERVIGNVTYVFGEAPDPNFAPLLPACLEVDETTIRSLVDLILVTEWLNRDTRKL